MYKQGDKFIIEVGSVYEHVNGRNMYHIKGFNTLVFDDCGLKRLKPLVNESVEAFNRGLAAGLEGAKELKRDIVRDYTLVKKDNVAELIKQGVEVWVYEFDDGSAWCANHLHITAFLDALNNENAIFYRKKEK